MLQINTGKHFTRGVGRTNQLRGVLFTNLRLPHEGRVETAAGTLLATDEGRHPGSIVFEMEERIEAAEEGPGVLISHTIAPFLTDMSSVASFALNGIVSQDVDLVRRMTNGMPGLSSYRSPREFIDRCFNESIYVSDDEGSEFTNFVSQLLALDRRTYLGAMRAIRTYVAGLHRIRDDLSLAYTLLVSSVESLAQEFDGHSSTWEDVDDVKRRGVDNALQGAPEEVAEGVRAAILAREHVSLGRRYQAFVLNQIGRDYFRTGLSGGRSVARSEIDEGLRQAYRLRSRYVHNLKGLPDALLVPHGHVETTYVDRRATLTFQGISRLSRHVISKFIWSGPTIEAEPYAYRGEEAGVVSLPLAAQYWVWKPLRDASHGRSRLEGFLQQLEQTMLGAENAALTDLRPMLKDVETLIPTARGHEKPALIALYVLFNLSVSADLRVPGYETVLDKNLSLLDEPSAEALIARTILDALEMWDIETHRAALDMHFQRRARPNGLQMPRLFDAAAILALAERYRIANENEETTRLVELAVDNVPGNAALIELEQTMDTTRTIDWRGILLPSSGHGAAEEDCTGEQSIDQ